MEFPSAGWLLTGAIILIGLIFATKKLLAYLLSVVVIMGSLLVAPDWLAREHSNAHAAALVAWREGIMPSPPWLQWLQGRG